MVKKYCRFGNAHIFKALAKIADFDIVFRILKKNFLIYLIKNSFTESAESRTRAVLGFVNHSKPITILTHEILRKNPIFENLR